MFLSNSFVEDVDNIGINFHRYLKCVSRALLLSKALQIELMEKLFQGLVNYN